ncbi:hypothetical protein [Peribacillus frigoritolerans]|uniref:hypothetical protein n=1 Tax=Peribacillus frigoritolerans TaxID=450367 RepID=UPI00384E4FAB
MKSLNTGINIFMNTVGGKWKCLILFFSESKTNEDKRVLYSNTGHYSESTNRPIKAAGKRWACPKRSI